MTRYVILRQYPSDETRFELLGRQDAAGAPGAIRRFVDENEALESGRYVAVPERSFTVEPVETGTERTIKVGTELAIGADADPDDEADSAPADV